MRRPRAEPGGVPEGDGASARVGRQIGAEPRHLRRGGAHVDLAVQREDVPAAEIVGVVAPPRGPRRGAEVPEIPPCSRRLIVVIAGHRTGAVAMAAPAHRVAAGVVRRGSVGVGVVPGGEHGARDFVEQVGGGLGLASAAARNVAGAHQDRRGGITGPAEQRRSRAAARPAARRGERGQCRQRQHGPRRARVAHHAPASRRQEPLRDGHLRRVGKIASAGELAGDDREGPCDDRQVVAERPVANVDQVERELERENLLDVGRFRIRAAEGPLAVGLVVEAPRPGQPRSDRQRLALGGRVVAEDEVGILGTRPHERHLSPQHVHELGELVDLRCPEEPSETEHPRIVRRRDPAARPPALHQHGPQLVHRERASAEAHPPGAVEHRAGIRQADADGGDREQRRGEQEPDAGAHHVKQAFAHGAASSGSS